MYIFFVKMQIYSRCTPTVKKKQKNCRLLEYNAFLTTNFFSDVLIFEHSDSPDPWLDYQLS